MKVGVRVWGEEGQETHLPIPPASEHNCAAGNTVQHIECSLVTFDTTFRKEAKHDVLLVRALSFQWLVLICMTLRLGQTALHGQGAGQGAGKETKASRMY